MGRMVRCRAKQSASTVWDNLQPRSLGELRRQATRKAAGSGDRVGFERGHQLQACRLPLEDHLPDERLELPVAGKLQRLLVRKQLAFGCRRVLDQQPVRESRIPEESLAPELRQEQLRLEPVRPRQPRFARERRKLLEQQPDQH